MTTIKEEKTIHQILVDIQQNLKVAKNQRNNFGNYNYRSCEDILEAVKPLLSECTLIIDDEIVNIGERYYVKATAFLSNGDKSISAIAYAREAADQKGMNDSQVTGNTSSYARKYALNGLFAIDDTKDADTMDNTKIEASTNVTEEITREPVENTLSRPCTVHNEIMTQKVSSKTGKPYFSHKNESGQMCFGTEYK